MLGVNALGGNIAVKLSTAPIFVDLLHESGAQDARLRLAAAEVSLGVI